MYVLIKYNLTTKDTYYKNNIYAYRINNVIFNVLF